MHYLVLHDNKMENVKYSKYNRMLLLSIHFHILPIYIYAYVYIHVCLCVYKKEKNHNECKENFSHFSHHFFFFLKSFQDLQKSPGQK